MDAPDLDIESAREMRRQMSLPEVMLWQVVRGGRLGVHFRRQHPIGPWILDFYGHACRLAVEIDGASHDEPDRIELDRKRGISTHRIPAREVMVNLDGVLDGLRLRVGKGPLHRRAGSPPPPEGKA